MDPEGYPFPRDSSESTPDPFGALRDPALSERVRRRDRGSGDDPVSDCRCGSMVLFGEDSSRSFPVTPRAVRNSGAGISRPSGQLCDPSPDRCPAGTTGPTRSVGPGGAVAAAHRAGDPARSRRRRPRPNHRKAMAPQAACGDTGAGRRGTGASGRASPGAGSWGEGTWRSVPSSDLVQRMVVPSRRVPEGFRGSPASRGIPAALVPGISSGDPPTLSGHFTTLMACSRVGLPGVFAHLPEGAFPTGSSPRRRGCGACHSGSPETFGSLRGNPVPRSESAREAADRKSVVGCRVVTGPVGAGDGEPRERAPRIDRGRIDRPFGSGTGTPCRAGSPFPGRAPGSPAHLIGPRAAPARGEGEPGRPAEGGVEPGDVL